VHEFLVEGIYPSEVGQSLKSLKLLIFTIKISPKAFEKAIRSDSKQQPTIKSTKLDYYLASLS